MSIEAMKQALDYIKDIYDHCSVEGIEADKEEELVQSLRQAIEQAENQEHQFKYTSYGLRSDESGNLSIGELPRKEWVGLTELEIAHGLEKANLPAIFSYRAAARAGIDAFKEKNT